MNDLDFVLKRIDPWVEKYICAGPSALDPLEVVGVGVWMLEAEVNNGGFDQYYFNSAGDLALQTVEALKAIGAGNTASLLSAANAEFPGSVPPVNRAERQEALGRIRETVRFASLEAEFYRYEEDLLTLLASYLRAHAGDG
ncbi:DMP19 family protein [Niveibacterium sp. 24ML]|uniref:DMP19 family protein n=1 Tax=Niveibacterium sp. 24ML TaxID=2985512 RepID=UPI00226DF4F3|nr:DMP19 family protein [Niveibacterium sp. 24ML]MCX9158601.1 DMP19 family protein [Niveibacterium sp. 24ML]